MGIHKRCGAVTLSTHPIPGGITIYQDLDTTWAPEFLGLFSPTRFSDQSGDVSWVFGLTTTTFPTNSAFALIGGVFDGVSSFQLDGARTDPGRAKNTPDGQVGGWFYRLVSPGEQLEDLTSLVVEINLQSGVSNALDSKLNSVIAALDDANENNDGAALNSMYAFCNSVSAQRGKKIDDADADELIAAASAIITTIDEFAPGCE